jgi:hypothetical protein
MRTTSLSPKFSGSPDLSPIETSWKGDTNILDR